MEVLFPESYAREKEYLRPMVSTGAMIFDFIEHQFRCAFSKNALINNLSSDIVISKRVKSLNSFMRKVNLFIYLYVF